MCPGWLGRIGRLVVEDVVSEVRIIDADEREATTVDRE